MNTLKIFLSSLFITLFAFSAESQELDTLHKAFMDKYDAINAIRDKKFETLSSGYIAALERLQKKLQSAGDLEPVLLVKDEISRINDNATPLEALPDKAPNELKKMRNTFLDESLKNQMEHAVALVGLSDKMQTLLKEKIKEMTKSDRLEDAQLANKMLETLSNDQAFQEAKNFIAGQNSAITNGGKWKSISYADYTVISQGTYYVGPIIGKKGTGIEDTTCIAEIKKYAKEEKNVFVMIPNCEVEFKADKSFTEFNGSVILTRASGSASIIIKIDGKKVKHFTLKGGSDVAEKITCKFAATEKIVVICNDENSIGNDSVGWVSMEVR